MSMSTMPRFSPKEMTQTIPRGTTKKTVSQKAGGRFSSQKTSGVLRQLSIERSRAALRAADQA